MSEDITVDALPEEGTNSADGNSAVSPDVSVAKTLSSVLGKDFEDDDTALKAVKDTFSYVGAVGQYKETVKQLQNSWGVSSEAEVLQRMQELTQGGAPVQPAAAPQPTPAPSSDELAALRRQVEEITFYKENPNLEAHKAFLSELSTSTGKSLAEVASSETFKGVLEKASAYDEAQKKRSVLESNPRLGQVRDKVADSRKALEEGNTAVAREAALAAVLDSMNQ